MYRKAKPAGRRAQVRSLLFLAAALSCAALTMPRAQAVTVLLTETDASSTVLLHVGDRLRLDLATAPAEGFQWNTKTIDASHLELLGKPIRPATDRPKASATQSFAWKALSPGQASIGLVYSRASAYSRTDADRTIPPAKHMQLIVEVVAGELAPAATGNRDPISEAVKPQAAYAGTLPCDNCLGIAVELTLYAPSTNAAEGSVFVEKRRYQGAPNGDRTIAGTGRYAVLHGTVADPAATVYVLGSPDGATENLEIEGDRLIQLDPQMLPMRSRSGQQFVLKKMADAASDP